MIWQRGSYDMTEIVQMFSVAILFTGKDTVDYRSTNQIPSTLKATKVDKTKKVDSYSINTASLLKEKDI